MPPKRPRSSSVPQPAEPAPNALPPSTLALMAGFRGALIGYSHASETIARRHGLTGRQYSLLVFVGAAGDDLISVGTAAEHLCLNHHSTVELSQRAEAAGLIERLSDPADGRRVLLELTAEGRRRMDAVTRDHVRDLREQREKLIDGLRRWTDLLGAQDL
ncbi:MarR family winged helix-turn-helix transcriptional regulator [Deinococcus pimensis]|uniref:MarR family winged helix-turn-helix transcriptional regulator n=1 Tax=Deinococcus pimensis TaxID=309888 RepID=UPI0004B7AD6F|nr:MarR family winged helix-turn-helix transcriptional regulator [Deinococcus pimensis]